MPILSRFYGILVKMYFNDHLPPHFHAEYGEYEAQIRIADLEIWEGYLPPKALSLVVEWANIHKNELMKNWDAMVDSNNGKYFKIEPLK